MARKRKKQNKNCLWWGLVLLVVIAAVVAGVIIWQSSSEDKYHEEQTPDTSEQDEKREKESEPTTENVELKSEGAEKKKVVQYEGEDPNEAENLSGVITRADIVGQNLVVRVNIDQYLGSGRCELSLVRNGSTIYTETANVVGVASTSTCEGFDVSVSGLGNGNTQINIKISADGREGTIRGEVNL